jgi:hypothetical protein
MVGSRSAAEMKLVSPFRQTRDEHMDDSMQIDDGVLARSDFPGQASIDIGRRALS